MEQNWDHFHVEDVYNFTALALHELNYFGPASRWPGDRSNQALEYVLKEGIPYNQDQVRLLGKISAYSGLEFDSLLQSVSKKPIPANIFIK